PVPPGAFHALAHVVKRPARDQPDQVVALTPRHLERLQEEVEPFIPADEAEEQRHATPGWELKLLAGRRPVRESAGKRRVDAVRHHVDAGAGQRLDDLVPGRFRMADQAIEAAVETRE